MEGMVKGLFGGGGDNDEQVNRARDFARRYTEGHPAEGYDDNEALEQFNSVIGNANEHEVEQATRATLQNLPESDRAQFGDFVSQLQQRERGSSSGGSFGIDDIAKMFGQSGGRANNAQDMFGGLLGGGGSGGGGGLGGLLGGLMGGASGGSGGGGLGGLLGGGNGGSSRGGSGGDLGGMLGGGNGGSSRGGSGGDLGGMLGGSMGKMILGGIAAYLIKNKLR